MKIETGRNINTTKKDNHCVKSENEFEKRIGAAIGGSIGLDVIGKTNIRIKS